MGNTLYIFDIDGTLTDSVAMYLMAVTKSMLSLGIRDIDTDYTNYKHHTDSYALRYNFERNFDKKYSNSLLEDLEDAIAKEMESFEPVSEIKGAKALIEYFRGHHIPFCFATGALPKPSILKLEQCSIWYDKDLIATSKTHETREGFILDAIERSKAFYNRSNFETIVSLGDGLWDLKTAQNLSLDFVGIGKKNKDIFRQHGVENYFDDIQSFREAMF